MEVSDVGHGLLLWIGVWTAGLVALSGSAGAHGPHGTGGEPVAFAVVVGLPVAAGLGGGGIALLRLRADRPTPSGRRVDVALGATLAVLGVTFAASAITTSRSMGTVGAVAGAVSALLVTRGGGAVRGGCHADVALGAVWVHRSLEGLALGTLYGAGAAVGLVGTVILAGHTALETAAVGGAYATGPLGRRAVGAILLVQGGYAVGAVAGLGTVGALPVSARAGAVAVAGGALLVVGAGETGRSIGARRPATA